MQTAKPLGRAGKRYDAALAEQLAIERFFREAHAIDVISRSVRAQPPGENLVIAETEGGQELGPRDGASKRCHGLAPGEPVVFLRIQQRAVQVPEYGARYRIHARPGPFSPCGGEK